LLELISQLLLEGHAHPFAIIDACLKCACQEMQFCLARELSEVFALVF
jgi:hypothetical protein